MKKRAQAMIMAALMIAALATSCSQPAQEGASSAAGEASGDSSTASQAVETPEDPMAPYEETVVIRVGSVIDANTVFPEGETAEDNRYTQLIKEKLNIEFETMWQVGSSADFNQKMNLSIASNDLPDATVVNKVQFRTMARSQQLEELGPVIDAYASDAMKAFFDTTDGDAIAAATYDGKVQGLPNVQADADGYHLLWIRKDWLDELGLDVPQTVQDVYDVAKAFVDNDMSGTGNTIGLSGPQSGGALYATFLASSNNVYGFDPIFSAMGSYPGYWIEKDGAVTYGSIEPETKEVLEFLQKMYKGGLIDPEMSVRANSEETVVSGQSGMFFGPWWMGYSPIPDAIRNDPEADWQAYAVPLNEEGEWTPHVSATTGQFTVVRKGYEHPEAIVKLANLAIVSEPVMDTATLSFDFWPLRNVQNTKDEVQVTNQILVDYLNGETTEADIEDKFTIYPGLKTDIETVKEAKLEPYDDMSIEYWDVEHTNFPRLFSMLVGASPLNTVSSENAVKSVVYEQTDLMQKKWSTLEKLEDETFLKIITGAEDISAFDDFVAQWKQQGGDEILAELAEVTE